ncbi:MAG: hypothetical protein ACYC4Q_07090 [Victivallaceae bacterium]
MNAKLFPMMLMAVVFCCPGLIRADGSYENLDKAIVEAYNANPKRTADVYAFSMEMIEKSRRDGGHEAEEWRDKAEKMVTLACFHETTLAIRNNDHLAAFIWAKRGLSGASRGEIGGINIKDVHEFLAQALRELESLDAVKKADFGKTKLIIADYRKTPPVTSGESAAAAPAADPKNHLSSYQLVAGPIVDAEGMVHVVVMFNRSSIKIFNYPGKGWKADTWQPFSTEKYYKSWQEAAAQLGGSKHEDDK